MVRKGLSGGSYKLLTDESIYKIHEAVMEIFEEIGFQVNSEASLELLKKAGARIDRKKNVVRIPRVTVLRLIRMAPHQVRLCGRDKKHDALLGDKRVYTGTGGTALYIYEPESNNRRQATLDDLKNITKLVDQLDNIHLLLLPTYPNDIPYEQVDVNRFFAGLNGTAKHVMGGVYTMEGIKEVIRMAEIIAGSSQALRDHPIISMIICTISPMKIDSKYGDMLLEIARSGIPVVCPAEPLCGATSPITLAGTVAIQTADSLMGVMLTQLANPGTPVIFGSVASSTDLSDLKYIAGSVEMGLLNAAGAQMAQFYRLPYYATGGMTDSKVLDAQSGYESAITNLLCALSGANFIHDSAGLMEFALSVCLEKLVIDNEILGMVMRAVDGIRVQDETLAMDVIREVGPGGHFVTNKHTRRFMRTSHFHPNISDRNYREDWEKQGEKHTWQRAAEEVKSLLANKSYSLPDSIRQQILSEIPGIVHQTSVISEVQSIINNIN